MCAFLYNALTVLAKNSDHDLHFFVVDAHTTALCGVDHRLELRQRSGYEYHVVDIEEGSNPVEVVNGGDLSEF